MASERCPCLSGLPYDECCGPLHRGEATAPTAERLMRSRFSGYARRLPDYLLATWHPKTRPKQLLLDADTRWYRLDILDRRAGGLLDSEGTVAFEAFYRTSHDSGSQRENSRFRREDSRWLYLDGDSY